jgi:4-hydroxyproline epimerase
MQRIHVIDSHTGGEPTRFVVSGFPDLGSGTIADKRERLRKDHDRFRQAVICEPRGSDVLVGALLCEPSDPDYVAGLVFFNNIGYLGMCGHGTIGVAVSLGHSGRIQAGRHRFETPVGVVSVEYDGANSASFENVPSYRYAKDVTIDVETLGQVTGDVAWGGNWFFLVRDWPKPIDLLHARINSIACQWIKEALAENGVTGADGAEIDHIELFGPPSDPHNRSRNFVLCPGSAYDRSPCGTGTSAKIACLAADGLLTPGEIWRQESVLGTVFTASYRREGNKIIPRISGQAYVTTESTLLIDAADPLTWGWGRP